MSISDTIRRGRHAVSVRTAVIVAVSLVVATGGVVAMSTSSRAADAHTVTLVNQSGGTVWIGSTMNADGSQALVNLPTLANGQSATIVIPDDGGANHWRGKFFARQGCDGAEGSSFRCAVGDCGAFAQRCALGEQPVSLAEFNFDRNDGLAPWYDVSYVNALSVPITISASGQSGPPAGTCINKECSDGGMLAACPSALAQNNPATGQRVNCLNPNRDGESAYTAAMMAFNPRAYLWSTQDRVPGNETMYNCAGCGEFVVTFHGGGGGSGPAVVNAGQPAAPPQQAGAAPPQQPAADDGLSHHFQGHANKCVDVPGAQSNDGAHLQLWDCNGTSAQQFTAGPNGSQVVLGKCLDVAWGSKDSGAIVQIAWCNAGPAQEWIFSGSTLRNPSSGKCLDVGGNDLNNGAPLIIWECNGQDNQVWRAG